MGTKILLLILAIFLIVPFTTAIDGVRNVECSSDSDCEAGYICSKAAGPTQWTCIAISPGSSNSQVGSYESSSNGIVIAAIIGGAVIIGFIILAIILKKKR